VGAAARARQFGADLASATADAARYAGPCPPVAGLLVAAGLAGARAGGDGGGRRGVVRPRYRGCVAYGAGGLCRRDAGA